MATTNTEITIIQGDCDQRTFTIRNADGTAIAGIERVSFSSNRLSFCVVLDQKNETDFVMTLHEDVTEQFITGRGTYDLLIVVGGCSITALYRQPITVLRKENLPC